MSRSMYGLHKAAGGFRARWRQAWADLPNLTCPLMLTNAKTGAQRPCGRPAAGFIDTIGDGPRPICAEHVPQGRRLGYTIYTSPDQTSS